MPAPWHGCKEEQLWWSGAGQNLEDKLCGLQKAGMEKQQGPCRRPDVMRASLELNVELFALEFGLTLV